MKKIISKLLCALALIFPAYGQTYASEVQSSDITMSYRNGFIPTSQQGDAFTFSFAHPVWELNGNPVYAVERYAFGFVAHPGYTLTGKMSAHLDATYQLDDTVGASAIMDLAFDVVIPICDSCSVDDGIYVNSAGGYALSTADKAGSLSISTGNSAVSGSYEHLLMYVVNDFSFTSGFRQINFNSITFTVEAVPISTVPELPPFIMLTIGLAVVAAGAWLRRGVNQPKSLS